MKEESSLSKRSQSMHLGEVITAASLLMMGHDPKTHHKHYGQFTTDEDIEESVSRAAGTLATANPGEPI